MSQCTVYGCFKKSGYNSQYCIEHASQCQYCGESLTNSDEDCPVCRSVSSVTVEDLVDSMDKTGGQSP